MCDGRIVLSPHRGFLQTQQKVMMVQLQTGLGPANQCWFFDYLETHKSHGCTATPGHPPPEATGGHSGFRRDVRVRVRVRV